MCCFWGCCTSDCYLHGLVLQAIWQFSRGHLALSKKGDSHHDWHLLSLSEVKLRSVSTWTAQSSFADCILKVRRGFLHAGRWHSHHIGLKLFFFYWDHGAMRWFFSLQATSVLIQVKILSNFGLFGASIEHQDEIHSTGPASKIYAHDSFIGRWKHFPRISILSLNSEPKNIITVQSYLVLVLKKFWISVWKHKVEVVKSIPLCPLHQEVEFLD